MDGQVVMHLEEVSKTYIMGEVTVEHLKRLPLIYWPVNYLLFLDPVDPEKAHCLI